MQARLSHHASTRRTAPTSPVDAEPDDPAIRRAIHLAALREMIDLGMAMARAAAAEVLEPEPADAIPEAPRPARIGSRLAPPARHFRSADPHLAFSRITRAVRQAIALETRIVDGTPAKPARYVSASADHNQTLLRKTLLDIARREPDRAARNQLCRHVNESLDAEFRDHPDARIEETMIAVANQLGLDLDFTKLPGELLGMPPRAAATGHPVYSRTANRSTDSPP